MNLILFDLPKIRRSLLPLTFTRPAAAMRVGIQTIAEKWQEVLGVPVHYLTEEYLQKKFKLQVAEDNLMINGALCPDAKVHEAIEQLKTGEGLVKDDILIAYRGGKSDVEKLQNDGNFLPENVKKYEGEITLITQPSDIFHQNAAQIQADFDRITAGRASQPIDDKHTIVYGEQNLFIEEGAQIRAAIINAESGPVYIGKNAQVHEGSIIKGSFALCEGSHVNMGAKIKGDSTVGPYSKVGGEVSNSVIFGYSNKAHDGFLGNSVIGEWCNLGADTNTSNLKNNYASVKVWNYDKGGFKDTGLTFCGLVMGDHSKCGINTMFNTGTVVGVSANIFGGGFPRNFIPSFAWGGSSGFITFQLRKVNEVAEKAMQRRSIAFDETEAGILEYIFQHTAEYRNWENKK